MATTPTINPSPAAGNSPSGPFTPSAHTHPFTAITGLRFGTNGRVEPVYDAANVFANGEIIALYNASSTPGAFAAPAVPKVTVQTAMILTDGPPEVAESNQQPQRFLAEGRITQREFNTVTTPTPPDGPPAKLPKNQSTSVNSPPATGTQFPLSYVLGDTGFTLDNIIGKGVIFSKSRVKAQKGLTEAQIVTNLTDWTKNIWIPFKKKYPTAFITNTFREGESQGQHGTGQAGDIQISGFPNVDYDQIGLWCVENLPYGQLLVEFTPGKNAWIHLSYENGTGITTKPINKVATMNGATFEFVPGIHKSMLIKARMLPSVKYP